MQAIFLTNKGIEQELPLKNIQMTSKYKDNE